MLTAHITREVAGPSRCASDREAPAGLGGQAEQDHGHAASRTAHFPSMNYMPRCRRMPWAGGFEIVPTHAYRTARICHIWLWTPVGTSKERERLLAGHRWAHDRHYIDARWCVSRNRFIHRTLLGTQSQKVLSQLRPYAWRV